MRLSVVGDVTCLMSPPDFLHCRCCSYSRIENSLKQHDVVGKFPLLLTECCKTGLCLFVSNVCGDVDDYDGDLGIFLAQFHTEQVFWDGSPLQKGTGILFADERGNFCQVVVVLSS